VSRATLRIATRASKLALWQADFVVNRLRSRDPDLELQIVPVTTTGDRARHASLASLGGIGIFTREIQQALLDERADLAVHSLKDLPTEPVDGILLVAVPERGSPWDALVLPFGSPPGKRLVDLPAVARVGTGSLRRQAQLRRRRPDLELLEVRGNVETRLRKLDDGQYDALVLAEAGLIRLGLAERISARLAPPEFFPAAGQGALAVECRSGDAFARSVAEQINDEAAWAMVTAERQILARLGAGCHAPVGIASSIEDCRLVVETVVLSADGGTRLCSKATGAFEDAHSLGTQIADQLLQQGAGPLVTAPRRADGRNQEE
jgi:hydroxymethylbilane synthase